MVEKLDPNRPFADWSDEFANLSDGNVKVKPLVWRGKLDLRGDPDDGSFLAAAQEIFGLSLPLEANTWQASVTTTRALWLGVDQWLMLLDRQASVKDIVARAKLNFGDGHFSLVEVSDNYAGVQITGAGARKVLTRALTLDVAELGVQRCVQTNFARTNALVICLNRGFELYVRPSFCDYLAQYLLLCLKNASSPGKPSS